MATQDPEVELRREAVRRRLEGERPCQIAHELGRSRGWVYKWWARFRHAPQHELASRSRAPRAVARKTPAAVERAVVRIRRALEAAKTPATRFGLIGHRAIRAEMERLRVDPLPSLPTIQRILTRHAMTHRAAEAGEPADYPALPARALNAIHATDIITRHVRGGQVVQNFHTFDLYSHAVHLTQAADKRSATACLHLIETWADLGLPRLAQFDNEDSFRGGHTHARVLGAVVRLCLYVGVEPLFIPFYEAERNHWVEGFHALWVKAFWSKYQFRDLADVRRQVRWFLRWYHERYQPPALKGKTPAQMRAGARPALLTPALRHRIAEPLPVTAGFIHFVRRVDVDGRIVVLNQPWAVGRRFAGRYVWARVETESQVMTMWSRKDSDAAWRQIRDVRFPIAETVHQLTPAFRRNCSRCPDHWPD
jgi:hypothetical protein